MPPNQFRKYSEILRKTEGAELIQGTLRESRKELKNAIVDCANTPDKMFEEVIPSRYFRLVPFFKVNSASFVLNKMACLFLKSNLSTYFFFLRNNSLLDRMIGSRSVSSEAKEIANNSDFAFNFIRLSLTQNFPLLLNNEDLYCSMTGEPNRLCIKIISNEYKNLMWFFKKARFHHSLTRSARASRKQKVL